MRNLFPLILLACGSATPESDVPSLAVATPADLPPCDSTDRIVYVESDHTLRLCTNSTWTTLDLTGPRGNTGSSGPTGATGTQGQPGKDATIDSVFASSIHCGAQLESTSLWFSYDAGVLKTGDILATGSIRDPYFEISQTQFYARTQVGAQTASVLFEYDLSGTGNYGYWTLSLNRTTRVTTIVYTDVDISGGTASWTMTSDKCIVNTYD